MFVENLLFYFLVSCVCSLFHLLTFIIILYIRYKVNSFYKLFLIF
nr:MAG TPA: Adipogenin [Caudoviricetes sp.]DAX42019.1 MAG TPA: Adipogenin [Caudoviricetes sp.]DAY02278.1 MAG TPA: Adipogenin [Caudoviricetes sp.]